MCCSSHNLVRLLCILVLENAVFDCWFNDVLESWFKQVEFERQADGVCKFIWELSIEFKNLDCIKVFINEEVEHVDVDPFERLLFICPKYFFYWIKIFKYFTLKFKFT